MLPAVVRTLSDVFNMWCDETGIFNLVHCGTMDGQSSYDSTGRL